LVKVKSERVIMKFVLLISVIQAIRIGALCGTLFMSESGKYTKRVRYSTQTGQSVQDFDLFLVHRPMMLHNIRCVRVVNAWS